MIMPIQTPAARLKIDQAAASQLQPFSKATPWPRGTNASRRVMVSSALLGPWALM